MALTKYPAIYVTVFFDEKSPGSERVMVKVMTLALPELVTRVGKKVSPRALGKICISPVED